MTLVSRLAQLEQDYRDAVADIKHDPAAVMHAQHVWDKLSVEAVDALPVCLAALRMQERLEGMRERIVGQIAVWEKERAACEAEMDECRKDPKCFQADVDCDECTARKANEELLTDILSALDGGPL